MRGKFKPLIIVLFIFLLSLAMVNAIPFDANKRYAFITSTTYNGDFGGVTGADTKCKQVASDAGFEGDFKALVTDGINLFNRLEHSTKPYVLPNGKTLVNNWDDLKNSNHQNKFNINEKGNELNSNVWTGDNGNNCNLWSTTSGSGATGFSGSTTQYLGDKTYWYSNTLTQCSKLARLYCLQQPPTLPPSTLSCTQRTSCQAGEAPLIKLSEGDVDDLHAALTTEVSYTNTLCCKSDHGPLTNQCTQASEIVVYLNAQKDSHATRGDLYTPPQGNPESGYIESYPNCLHGEGMEISCEYKSSCTSGGILELAGDTDAHPAPYGSADFPVKVCCTDKKLCNPGDLEVCDGIDNDCDGEIDEGTDGDSSKACCELSSNGWSLDLNQCCGDDSGDQGKEVKGSGNNFWKCQDKKWTNLLESGSIVGTIIFTQGDDFDSVADTNNQWHVCDIDNNQAAPNEMAQVNPILSILGHDYVCYSNSLTNIETIAECKLDGNNFRSEEGAGGERYSTGGKVTYAGTENLHCCNGYWKSTLDSSACLNTCTLPCAADGSCSNACFDDPFCDKDPDCGVSCTKNCDENEVCNFECYSDDLCRADPDCGSEACSSPDRTTTVTDDGNCCGDTIDEYPVTYTSGESTANLCCSIDGACVANGECRAYKGSSTTLEVCTDGVDNDCDCPGDTNNDEILCGPGDEGVDVFDNDCAGQKDSEGRVYCSDDGFCVDYEDPDTGKKLDPGGCGKLVCHSTNKVCTTEKLESKCPATYGGDMYSPGCGKFDSCAETLGIGLTKWDCRYTKDNTKCLDDDGKENCDQLCDPKDFKCKSTQTYAQNNGGDNCYITHSACMTSSEDPDTDCDFCHSFDTDCASSLQQTKQVLGGEVCESSSPS